MPDQDEKDKLFRRHIAAIRLKPTKWQQVKPLVLTALILVAMVLVAWIAAMWVTSSGPHPERFQ